MKIVSIGGGPGGLFGSGMADAMPDRPADPGARAPGAAVSRPFVLAVLGLAAAYLLWRMLWPFLPAIVLSAILAVLVHPLYAPLRERIRPPGLAALLVTIAVFVLGLIPTVGVSMLLLNELRSGVARIGGDASGWLAPGGTVSGWVDRIAAWFAVDASNVVAVLTQQAQGLTSTLAARTVNLFAGLGGWLLQAAVALFTLFYMLRDGDRLVAYVRWLLPLEPAASDRLLRRARETTHATVFGTLVVAVVQGVLGGLAFWALGLRAPVVWGAVMALLSLLPAVGAWFVWAPAALLLLAGGEIVRGIVLMAVGAFLISTVDNVLRAVLVSGRAELHPLVVFFSVLGGLFVFGAAGVFIGPVLFVVALTLIEMARLSAGGDQAPSLLR